MFMFLKRCYYCDATFDIRDVIRRRINLTITSVNRENFQQPLEYRPICDECQDKALKFLDEIGIKKWGVN